MSFPNFVLAKICLNFSVFLGISSSLFFNKSSLLNAMVIFSHKISLKAMHSTVWIWIPFTLSITKMTVSIIEAPEIIVLISEACPGQSTKVIWIYSLSTIFLLLWKIVSKV